MVLDHLGHGINLRDDTAPLWSSYVALSDRLVAARFDLERPLRAFFIGGGAAPVLTDDHAPVARLLAQHFGATFDEP